MSERFDIKPAQMKGLNIVARKPIGDSRGWFERVFCMDALQDVMGCRNLVQINRTLTEKMGAVRGMHFQSGLSAEMKIVSCLRGEVFDVVVDLRAGSATFLQWHAELLSADNRKTLVIPEGFAHGFQTLTEDCEMLYLHTAAYNPIDEEGLNPMDPSIAITWPIPLTHLSKCDAGRPMIAAGYKGVSL